MSDIIVTGADEHELTARLADRGLEVVHLDGEPIGDDLVEAGIESASAFVLTDAKLAISVSVAKERNPDLIVVFYSHGRLPPYASRQADLAVDPDLITPEDFVDAVVDRIESVA